MNKIRPWIIPVLLGNLKWQYFPMASSSLRTIPKWRSQKQMGRPSPKMPRQIKLSAPVAV